MDSDAPLAEKQPDLIPANAVLPPGFGGWTPTRTRNLIASCLGGAVTAAGAVLSQYDPAKGALNAYQLGGAALIGCATGALGYLGIGSAGTRKLE